MNYIKFTSYFILTTQWGIVQLVERATVVRMVFLFWFDSLTYLNRYVVGSSPTAPVERIGNVRFFQIKNAGQTSEVKKSLQGLPTHLVRS